MNATSGPQEPPDPSGGKRKTDRENPLRPTHLDEEGRAHMVDVGGKRSTRRLATATALVVLPRPVRDALIAGDLPKGEALGVARIAGIHAAKETSRLIPLCHPLALDSVRVAFETEELKGSQGAAVGLGPASGLRILATVGTTGPTGVEMEALAAVTVAGLTIYDMVKGLHRGCSMEDVRLLAKEGGAGGPWVAGTPES